MKSRMRLPIASTPRKMVLPTILSMTTMFGLSTFAACAGEADDTELRNHLAAGVIAHARSPGGRVLASAALDGSIHVYNEIGRSRGGLSPRPRESDGTSTVTALALSPDGSRIMSAYSNGDVLLCSTSGGTHRRIYETADKTPAALATGAKHMAVGFEDGSIELLPQEASGKNNTKRGSNRLAPIREHTGAVRRLLFSPDEKLLASAGDDDLVLVHKIPSGEIAAALRVTGAPVSSLTFDAQGSRLFIATEGDGVRVYETTSNGSFSLRTHLARGTGILAVAHKPGFLAAADFRGPVLLYKFGTGVAGGDSSLTGAPLVLRGHLTGAVLLSFNSEGLVSADGGDAPRRWKLDGTPIESPYLAHPDRVRHFAFAPSDKFIAAALGGNGVENAVWLWSKSGRRIARHTGHEQGVDCVAVSPDGLRLASGSSDNTIRLITLDETGAALGPPRILKEHERRITRLDFSPDGRYLLSAAGDGTIRLRRAVTGEVLQVLRGHRGTVTRARFSMDGRFILSGGGDRTLRLWPIINKAAPVGKEQVFKGHTLGITAAAISPDGSLIASAAWDRTLRLFHTKTGSNKTIQLPERQWVIALAFHPRKKIFVGGGWDGGVRFWNYQGRELVRFKDVHEGRVSALAFSSDGKYLVTSSYDRTIRRRKLDDVPL